MDFLFLKKEDFRFIDFWDKIEIVDVLLGMELTSAEITERNFRELNSKHGLGFVEKLWYWFLFDMGFTTVFEFSLYAILALYLTDDIVFLYLGKIAVSWLINFDVAIFIPDFLGYLDETE